MTQTELDQLIILEGVINCASAGGMREIDLKKLCYDTLRGTNEGEEFFTAINQTHYLVGKAGFDSHMYFVSASGLFRLRDLQKKLLDESNSDRNILTGIRWSKSGARGAWIAAGLTFIGLLITLYFGCHPIALQSNFKTMDTTTKAMFYRTNDSVKKVEDSSGAMLDSQIPSPPSKSKKPPKPAILLLAPELKKDSNYRTIRSDTIN